MNDPHGQQQGGGQDPWQYGQQQGGSGNPQSGGSYPNMPQPQQSPSPQAGYAPYEGGVPYGTPQQNHTLAIVSLICSIASIVVCGPAAIAGVITGHMARRRIRENPSAYTGDGMALAGLIIGWIMTALFVLLLVFGIAMVVIGTAQGIH